MTRHVLLSPLAAGAYFDAVEDVARAELAMLAPGASIAVHRRGPLTLLSLDHDVPDEVLARASCAQAVLDGPLDALRIREADPGFGLPADLVWGAKYRGKTHELVTQLALNAAIAACRVEGERTLVDPMAGRGTTLLWAARYGLSSVGVERDADALGHLQRHVGWQTKHHRLKHTAEKGSTVKKNRDGVGRYVGYAFGSTTLRLTTGDTRELPTLVQRRRFSLLVTDLPYGVQFVDRSRGDGRDPLPVIEAAADGWIASLEPGGAMALVFNRLLPRREALADVFVSRGLEVVPLEVAHRMSASIHRDVLVLRRG